MISLVQGRLNDSLGLLDLADRAAAQFETSPDGSVRTRIALNRCVVEIDRGKLIVVEEELRSILARPETEPLRAVACGYLGLVHHLRGEHETAEKHYKTALNGSADPLFGRPVARGLVELRRSRAASIFSRHYGDLQRKLGDKRLCFQFLENAISLAQEGGHEDIRHHALMAQIRSRIYYREESDFNGQLREIERYAKMMGIPKLVAEVYELRARVRRRAGDLTEARALAMRGLQVATLHDMRLRKTGLLVLLAYIHKDLGDFAASRAVVGAAISTARRSDHHIPMAEAMMLQAELDLKLG